MQCIIKKIMFHMQSKDVEELCVIWIKKHSTALMHRKKKDILFV